MLRAHTVSRRRIELREDPVPAPLPGHALVRVHHVSLCGTDLHLWDDDYPAGLPVVQGHEFAGTVEEAWPADGQTAPAPGTPVAVSPMVYCGDCAPCRAGRFNVCETISCLGCYEDGALAELVRVPLDKLCALPAGLPLDLAPLGEPGSIAMQAVNRGTPVAGETALVLGCGPIGLLATLYLRDLGVTVLAADTVPARLALAERFGAAAGLLVGPGEFPASEQRRTLDAACPAGGPTLVIEATGVPASFENAVRLAAPTARIVQVGISTRTAALSLRDVPFKELDIRGSRNSLNLIPDALRLLAAHPEEARALVTHRFGLADLDAAFGTLADPAQGAGKVLIDLPAAGAESAGRATAHRSLEAR